MLRIVGLGPGDPDLPTLGSLAALRAIGRAVTVLAPPELVLFLEREGVRIERDLVRDPQLFLRGSSELVDEFAGRLDERDLGLGVLGNPLSDFAGLPILLRALEARRIPVQIVPGMPRATLQAAIAMPLVPLPPGAAPPLVPLGSGADASLTRPLSHRGDVRARRGDRKRRRSLALRRARRPVAPSRLPRAARHRGRTLLDRRRDRRPFQ